MPYNDNIENPDYSITTAYNFFIGGDFVRVIILLYILFCFILNLLIIIAIFISKKKLSFISKITLSILFVNFIHTFSYIYEWVIKIEGKNKIVGDINDNTIVGFLLTGNPNNMGACLTQSFSLISSSISQDFLINIFFFLINRANTPSIFYIWLWVLILAFAFPFIFTLILLLVGALGINDRFCYVNKYKFNKTDNRYELYSGFEACVTLVYAIRAINLIFSFYIIIKILKYIMEKKLKLSYIFKISSILLVQLVTITIGVIYRISSYFSKKFSVNFSGVYLILNTMDGVLFPLSFIISSGMHKILYKLFTGKTWGDNEEEEEVADYPNKDDDDDYDINDNNIEKEKKIPMQDLSKKTTDNSDNKNENYEDNEIGSIND